MLSSPDFALIKVTKVMYLIVLIRGARICQKVYCDILQYGKNILRYI